MASTKRAPEHDINTPGVIRADAFVRRLMDDHTKGMSCCSPLQRGVHGTRICFVIGIRKLLKSLEIQQAGFHAFRHFNVSLLDSLRVPLKVIQERVGHATATSNEKGLQVASL